MQTPAQHMGVYYQRTVSLMLVLAFAMIHVRLTGVYDQATPQLFYDFIARLPYAQRLLVPLLARGTGYILPLSVESIFFLWEVFFVAMTYWAMNRLLKLYLDERYSTAYSWLFLLLLPLVYVVNYRLVSNDKSMIFYPCDSATLFFMVIGLKLCLQKSWRWLVLITFLATINRESALLLVFLIPCLHWRAGFKLWLKPFAVVMLSYLLAKLCVTWVVSDLPGTYTEWYYRALRITTFQANFYYLTHAQVLFFYIYCFAGLPLFAFALYDDMPTQLKPLRWLCLAYFIPLLMVGHLLEARIYGEIVSLLYLPVVLAMHAWINHQPRPKSPKGSFLIYLDRYGIISILFVLLVFRGPANQLVRLLASNLS